MTKDPKPIVVYSNDYTEAFYQTDYLSKKMMIASSLRCKKKDWHPEGCEIELSANELQELTGLTKNSLKHLEKAVDKLHKTIIRLKNPDDPRHWISFNYLPKGEYKDGVLKLLINAEMKPFIQGLQKNFTQYHIENIKFLKSGYSIRIFELLKMHAYKKIYLVKIDNLRKMFGLEKKYTKYNNFKQNVIIPAYKELKEHCDIYFEFIEKKKGRQIVEIEFKIFNQKKHFVDIEASEDITVNTEIIPSTEHAEKENFISEKSHANTTEFSPLATELISLGFNGNVEKYIETNGENLIYQVLNDIKKTQDISTIQKPIGLLRFKIIELKKIKQIEKDLEKQQENLEIERQASEQKNYIKAKSNLIKVYELRVEQRLIDSVDEAFCKDFTEYRNQEYHKFEYTKQCESMFDVLSKVDCTKFDNVTDNILKMFINWKGREI
jgi:plasmid replication initiation protein